MHRLELKIPPVALFILMLVIMYQFSQVFYSAKFVFPYADLVFGALILVSGGIGVAGVYEFRKAKTTVNPVKIDQASCVVDQGIFAYTRNPMYLALMVLLVGFAIWLQNYVSMLWPMIFVWYMNRFQIKPEERVLEQLFGADYLKYKQKVRRWI